MVKNFPYEEITTTTISLLIGCRTKPFHSYFSTLRHNKEICYAMISIFSLGSIMCRPGQVGCHIILWNALSSYYGYLWTFYTKCLCEIISVIIIIASYLSYQYLKTQHLILGLIDSVPSCWLFFVVVHHLCFLPFPFLLTFSILGCYYPAYFYPVL